ATVREDGDVGAAVVDEDFLAGRDGPVRLQPDALAGPALEVSVGPTADVVGVASHVRPRRAVDVPDPVDPYGVAIVDGAGLHQWAGVLAEDGTLAEVARREETETGHRGPAGANSVAFLHRCRAPPPPPGWGRGERPISGAGRTAAGAAHAGCAHAGSAHAHRRA